MTNKNINITFTDGTPVEVDQCGIIRVPTIKNNAAFELTAAYQGIAAERHAVCYLCGLTALANDADLERRGWHLAPFELCPNHAGGERVTAWTRFDREMSAAYGV